MNADNQIDFGGHPTVAVPGGNFSAFNLNLRSNTFVPEAHRSDAQACDCVFELRRASSDFDQLHRWLQQCYIPSGKPWRSSAKREDGYLVRFHDLADFVISFVADRITCKPAPGIPIETIRHLLLDQVLPLSLGLRGIEALHASSLVTQFGAIGLLGETGTGKSTLAASLVEAGCTLLGDDCLPLETVDGQVVAIPSYPSVRLWPRSVEALYGNAESHPQVAHYNPKKRIQVESVGADAKVLLAGLFVLTQPHPEPNQSPKLEPVSASDALKALLEQSFRLDITDRAMTVKQFEFFGKLIGRIPVYRLSYPRRFELLPEVHRIIFDALAS